jgi:hypothetical protein
MKEIHPEAAKNDTKSSKSSNSQKQLPTSVADLATFMDNATMTSRREADGNMPVYTWKDIVGMILLDSMRAGNLTGLTCQHILDKILVMLTRVKRALEKVGSGV